MRKFQVKDLITKFHFLLLGLCLLNFLLKKLLGISLNYGLTYFFTILLYLSGIVLFVWNFKPFKKLTLYFGIYALTPILTFAFWAFGGVLSGILASIVLYPIYPNNKVAENENIVIYKKYSGFLGACCTYVANEKTLFLFEKKVTEIKLSEITGFESSLISSENGLTEWKIAHKEYDYKTKKYVLMDKVIPIRTE